jgi:hypothetical protein
MIGRQQEVSVDIRYTPESGPSLSAMMPDVGANMAYRLEALMNERGFTGKTFKVVAKLSVEETDEFDHWVRLGNNMVWMRKPGEDNAI